VKVVRLNSRHRRGTAAVGLVTAALLGAFVGCNQSATSGSGATTRHAVTSSHRGPATAFGGSIPTFAPAPAPEPITVSRSGSVAPIFQRLPIHQRVAFLTMDDGQTRLAAAHRLMAVARVPFTMFLIAPVAARNPSFFKQLQADGGWIEDHTLTHRSLRGKPYLVQRREICGAKDRLNTTFGIHTRLFRPPYGAYDGTTLKAVHDCGLQAAFSWSETVENGTVSYQTSVHRIHPGDIILMHFKPTFVQDVLAALRAIHDAGLTPALLENYIR
jgi:peptidoglycan/xylan/chitin deacetylase (PgdA/CDA1 family)